MTSAPTKYDIACRALAEVRSVDEVKELHDKAEAMRAYARQAKNKELETDAAEIRIRAERRLGEMIAAQKATVELDRGSLVGGATREPPRDTRPTLADAGIDKKLSSRAQKLAAVPDRDFEAMLGEWRKKIQIENEQVTTRLLRAGEIASARNSYTLETPGTLLPSPAGRRFAWPAIQHSGGGCWPSVQASAVQSYSKERRPRERMKRLLVYSRNKTGCWPMPRRSKPKLRAFASKPMLCGRSSRKR